MNSFIFILIFQGAKIDNHEQFTYKILAEFLPKNRQN